MAICSINEYVKLVQLLDISFDLSQLPLIVLFSSLRTSSVHQSYMSMLLVLVVYLAPLSLQAFSKFSYFFLRKNVSYYNIIYLY